MGALPGVTGVLTGLVLGERSWPAIAHSLCSALHLIYLENCANKTSARVRSDADSLPPAMVKSHSRVVVHTGSRSHARGADSVRDGVCPLTCPSLWPHRTREKQRRRAASAKQAAIPPSWCQRVLYVVVMLSSTASSRAVCARSARLRCRRAAVRSVMLASRLLARWRWGSDEIWRQRPPGRDV